MEFNIFDVLGGYEVDSAIPGDLYHYTSINSLKSIIESGNFWVTNARFMNDAAESIYFFDVLYQAIVQIQAEEENHKDAISSFCHIILAKFKRVMASEFYTNNYILSFSLNPDSLSMWNYYGKNDGYCIGVSADGIIQKLNEDYTNARYSPYVARVLYDSSHQILILKTEIYKVFRWYIENMSEIHENYRHDIVERLFSRWSVYASVFKHPSFANEEEFRFVFYNYPDPNDIKYRIYQSILAPYIEMKFTNDNNQLPINSITVGPMVKHDLALVSLSSWLNQLKDFPLSQNLEIGDQLRKSSIPLRF